METEKLKVFDRDGNQTGVATREEVHRKGLWHEAFQCWFIERASGKDYIYLQLRSGQKKDYPNKFDITAAGHLLADESVEDGVREVKEELGIDVSVDDLVSAGVIEYSVQQGDLIDNEFANVFLYEGKFSFNDFKLQEEEVVGLVKTEFTAFRNLWTGAETEIKVGGFEIRDGRRMPVLAGITRDQFVPHDEPYYHQIIEAVENYLDEND